ncbi:uncharacterized protein (DUF58 family) [Pullulanibacillus pueri]|uniref:DUF58 domain-containing protein n=1 Tax=Pullulanibacillus pueri TaxID=1437324 RepID=A0A8J3EM74_9BACL|nr:DUF58 domain-containing protein [Pullulanibacillus pueri]MBM7681623.1 uncharacterized protein (DUF58 family) [Pullulanibacillus pueri]GGH79414.1 hypothetical protein GCM10007096_14300 [Pullulanibacillus pueri]
MMGRGSGIASTIIDGFVWFGGALLIFSLLIGQSLLFFAAAFLLVLGVYPRLYLNYIVQHFGLLNDKEKLRLSQGEKGRLHLVFENSSRLPIVNAELFFSLDKNVTVLNIPRRPYALHLFMPPKQTTEVTLEIEAVARGVVKMKELKVVVHDPLHLASITLSTGFVKKEIVVYPKSQAVTGLDQLILPIEGDQTHQHSLYEDRTSPVGTRSYVPTDPIKNVHWKASARTGQLQTKIFDKTMGMIWTFVIFLDMYGKKGQKERLEEELSRVTAICQIAQKQGVDFELYVNTRTVGQGMFMKLPPGHGSIQLVKAMEFLAFINTNQLKTPPPYIIRDINQEMRQKRLIIMMDHTNQALTSEMRQKWRKKGHRVFTLEAEGILSPIGIRRERYVE